MAFCYFCRTELPHGQRIYRTTDCPSCGKPIKICLNCEFYDPTAHYQCREDIGEPVRDKERANFCDYFSARKDFLEFGSKKRKQKAKESFNSLFSD